MAANESDTGRFVSSIHRSILGALLAVAGLVGLGWGRQAVADGDVLLGAAGVVLACVAAGWIASLFLDGFRER